jgi:hypothetical protein
MAPGIARQRRAVLGAALGMSPTAMTECAPGRLLMPTADARGLCSNGRRCRHTQKVRLGYLVGRGVRDRILLGLGTRKSPANWCRSHALPTTDVPSRHPWPRLCPSPRHPTRRRRQAPRRALTSPRRSSSFGETTSQLAARFTRGPTSITRNGYHFRLSMGAEVIAGQCASPRTENAAYSILHSSGHSPDRRG